MDNCSTIKLYCNKCGCEIWHSQEWTSKKTEYYSEELELEDISEYYVYKCHNCGKFCFVHFCLSMDGIELVDKIVDRYPKSIEGISKIKNLDTIPDLICKIYNETFIAIINECYILAMIGIRSIIEAISIEEGIKISKKKKLNELIKDMKNDGLICKKEEELIQKIREKGNEAVHEIIKIDKDTLLNIFDIINNMLEKLYCFDL